jgi:threonyl-tRNA synthetase
MSKINNELKDDPLMPLRHSAEHVLHCVMQRIHPDLKKVMGPPIEDGFYFDFDLDYKVTPEDMPKIEAEMQKMIDANLPIVRREVLPDEAKKLFADNLYKLENIKEIEARGEKVSIYTTGDPQNPYYDVDLCAGPHTVSTGDIKAFKLLSIAGAYYKGDEKNKMLQRIYGTAFDSQEALEKHLHNLEEAKKRDHRKLGPELGLFMFHETAPGEPYWLPNGTILLNELINFWRTEHTEKGYKEISSPLVNKKELWETSGHWDHYKDDMFIADMGEGEIYGIKPMNCPNAMIVFGSQTRSYKDLPLRLSDTDCLHRYERSGTLNGLLRARSFRQDDSHNFISEDQIESEYAEIFDIVDRFYGIFNLEYSLRLGTRPQSFMGDIETWNKAEASLHKVLEKKVGKDGYIVLEGDGAFYGPKVDILMKDVLGREWQMGTIQLDFQIPRNFNLKYTTMYGSQKTPVVVHRVIYGSLERFVGIIIEHFSGAFPVWLAPVQVALVPISEKNNAYAQKVAQILKSSHLRVEIDKRDETMQAKIRDAQMQKVPYILVVGGKEESDDSVNVRLRDGTVAGMVKTEVFAERAAQKYLTKALDLW